MFTASTHHRRWHAAILVACFGLSTAAICGSPSPPATPTGAVIAGKSPTPSPQPMALPTIDVARLPVRLNIPGAPDSSVAATAIPNSAALQGSFGDYLHVVDLSAGTARLLGDGALALPPRPFFRPGIILSPDRAVVAYSAGEGRVVVVNVSSGRSSVFLVPEAAVAGGECHPTYLGMVWAPDSTRLALKTAHAWFVLDTSSGEDTAFPIIRSGGPCAIGWSPSGEWIVFEDNHALVRVRPDGTDRFDGPPYYAPPDFSYTGPRDFVWSPDSTRVYFTADKFPARLSFGTGLDLRAEAIPIGASIAWNTELMYADTHELPFINALSSDGSRAAYVRFDHDANYVSSSFIETRNVDGTNGVVLASYAGGAGGSSVRGSVAWSPDDAFVAISVHSGSFENVHIIDTHSGADVAVAAELGEFRAAGGGGVMCELFVLGWASPTSVVTTTHCEGTE